MAGTEAGAAMSAALPFELSRLFEARNDPARDDAWAEFLAAHSRLLLHVARAVTTNRDAAMDAYTSMLERLREDDYRRLRGYAPDGRSKFTTWLVVVARRLCLDLLRRRYGRPPPASAGGDPPLPRAGGRRGGGPAGSGRAAGRGREENFGGGGVFKKKTQ